MASTQKIIQAIEEGYKGKYPSGFGDEHTTPLIAGSETGEALGRIEEEDSVIFFNFRQDRAREISEALTGEERDNSPFNHFNVDDLQLDFVSFTQYHQNFKFPIAFQKIKLERILSEILSEAGINQLRIAETEKYAHVTFFTNGGEEKKYSGEDWVMINSPKVATYDLQPEMSAPEVTQTVLEKIDSRQYGFLMLNYANPDMVGHTGKESSILKAVEVVDSGVGQIIEAMKKQDGIVIITADHGNCEEMYATDEKGEVIYQEDGKPKPSTEHSSDKPVPFILFGPDEIVEKIKLREEGVLADIAPTILEILNLEKPEEMQGKSMLIDYEPTQTQPPLMLIVMDGWGLKTSKEGNAPQIANAKNIDFLMKNYPTSKLIPFGEAVGLPKGTMGNSEVGHMNIGAGRVVLTDYDRINKSIADGSFYKNPALVNAVKQAKKKGKALHLMGLTSDIGVHADLNHLIALIELARQHKFKNLFIHAFLDGRDSAPDSGAKFLKQVQAAIEEKKLGEIVSAIGRYYAMDRDNRWDRIQVAYEALVHGKGTLV